MSTISFTDRVVIVTGGGRGLGAAYSRELARRGAAVVIADNGCGIDGNGQDPAPAHDVVKTIVADGGRAVASTEDLSTEKGGQLAIDLAEGEYGRLDAVVANAGNVFNAPIEDWPADRFESLLRHHLMAAFNVVRPGFAVMKRAGYGRVVLVSSSAGVFGQHGMLGYSTAKTGMLGLMNVLSLEGSEFGITANAIMPMARTRMADAITGVGADDPDGSAFLDTMRQDQVAPVVAYLASEACTKTQTVFSAFMGRVAALQIGVTRGWTAPDGTFSADDVATHLPEILDTTGLLVPRTLYEEMAHVTTPD
ncbi:SDR family NAD(P)-dependent oxidoreductase [Mycobacterium frederiksbergense]|uniref:SDR family NAD(P)-dependent oxidoreductase n=1 Tax=Mycolicibacterium frederiksbergense TaxID=117567 RepID=UPI0021F2E7AC|nr:SDR family NAD(P)-dependent oxidoreductase [Mycolicibacterium frederiksbergense]MCV7047524.1 SDR family NAD(P)-dependent oxidoreductase [Mycolicibacterium frederiksbergense]